MRGKGELIVNWHFPQGVRRVCNSAAGVAYRRSMPMNIDIWESVIRGVMEFVKSRD